MGVVNCRVCWGAGHFVPNRAGTQRLIGYMPKCDRCDGCGYIFTEQQAVSDLLSRILESFSRNPGER